MKLVCVSGIVNNLIVSKGRENILFSANQREYLGVGAAAAAALGEGLSSTVLSSASSDAEIAMDFFRCTVDNVLIKGRFYKVEFKNGDFMHFAVDDDHEVHGACDRIRRLVWTIPYHTKGHIAQKKSNIVGIFQTAAGFATLSFFAMFFLEHPPDQFIFDWPLRFAALGFFIMLVVGYRASRKVFRNATDATLAFEALGFKDPANLNLPKYHRSAEKRYLAETGTAWAPDTHWRYRYDDWQLADSA